MVSISAKFQFVFLRNGKTSQIDLTFPKYHKNKTDILITPKNGDRKITQPITTSDLIREWESGASSDSSEEYLTKVLLIEKT